MCARQLHRLLLPWLVSQQPCPLLTRLLCPVYLLCRPLAVRGDGARVDPQVRDGLSSRSASSCGPLAAAAAAAAACGGGGAAARAAPHCTFHAPSVPTAWAGAGGAPSHPCGPLYRRAALSSTVLCGPASRGASPADFIIVARVKALGGQWANRDRLRAGDRGAASAGRMEQNVNEKREAKREGCWA